MSESRVSNLHVWALRLVKHSSCRAVDGDQIQMLPYNVSLLKPSPQCLSRASSWGSRGFLANMNALNWISSRCAPRPENLKEAEKFWSDTQANWRLAIEGCFRNCRLTLKCLKILLQLQKYWNCRSQVFLFLCRGESCLKKTKRFSNSKALSDVCLDPKGMCDNERKKTPEGKLTLSKSMNHAFLIKEPTYSHV